MKYIDYVNIKQGTDSVARFSNGNTLPLVQLPFGMASFSPQTDGKSGSFFYNPNHNCIEGVRLTHQPSPWIGDYGALVFMPQEGEPKHSIDDRLSSYRPHEAVLRPDYIKLYFQRYNALLELSPTERGAVIKLSYEGDLTPRFAVLPVGDECGYTLYPEKRLLTGYTKQHTWQVHESFAMYFAVEFNCDLEAENSFLSLEGKLFRQNSGKGEDCGYNVALGEKNVTARLAISYISEEQALENLRQDNALASLEAALANAKSIWESYLSRIEITASEKRMKTFYSCLYRMFLFPHKFHELDKNGKTVHYKTNNGEIGEGVLYVDNGFWDTFRTVYPLFAIIAPEIYEEALQGFVNFYKDTGWLPKWPSPSEVGLMPGTLIDAVIGHAAVTESVSDELLSEAYTAALKHINFKAQDERYGRHGTDDYNKYGYIPRERYRESVNHTLDYVYGDFCIAQAAHKLGDTVNEQRLLKSAQNYKSIFDFATGFMRGRDVNGNMKEGFNPYDWGGEYCEGSAWQNSFAVYHDIEGLAKLYGGNERLIERLDELFSVPTRFNIGGYATQIHEMAEMAAASFGQCAISNQPSFHLPYMYAALGCPEKTEYWVEKIVDEAFSFEADGFPGDEDNGSMSGWYVFSLMGFYPICPSKPEYIRGKTLVSSLKILGKEINLNSLKGQYINHFDLIKIIKG